jgi:heat shock protein HslJ
VNTSRLGITLLGTILLLTACGAVAPTPPQSATPNLGGTSWQLVKFQGSDDKTLTPDDKAKYTIEFGTDGGLSARIDCNRGRGTWKSSGPSQLQLSPLALTRAMCPPGSLHDRIVKDWNFVRSYVIKDGHLFLSLMADGGIYEFEPMAGAKSASVKSPVADMQNTAMDDPGKKPRPSAVGGWRQRDREYLDGRDRSAGWRDPDQRQRPHADARLIDSSTAIRSQT